MTANVGQEETIQGKDRKPACWTAKELIDFLKEVPPSTPIVLSTDGEGNEHIGLLRVGYDLMFRLGEFRFGDEPPGKPTNVVILSPDG